MTKRHLVVEKTAKVAISMPASTLAAIEQARQATGESRSQFMRRAVEEAISRERERRLVEQYIEGYRRYPESDEEIALADVGVKTVFAENPWDEDENAER
jgi:metal-responsive CopG/Arc/MetJ family transcriptional regulator